MARGPSTLSTKVAPSSRRPLGAAGHLRLVPALRPDHPVGHGELGELRADDGSPFAQAARWWRSRARAPKHRARRPHRRRSAAPLPAARPKALRSLSSMAFREMVERSRAPLASSRHELTPWPERRRGRSSLYAEARGSAGPAGRSEHRRCRARLVRPRAPPPAVAGRARRGARSLPRLAQRDHAAADDGQGGAAALRSLPAPLARRDGVGARRAWRGARRLGRARLLRPRAQPACLRARGGGAARRQVPRGRGRTAQAAGHRRLYRRRHRGHRLRQARDAGRRQYRARGGAAVRRGHAAARRQGRDQGARRDADARRRAPATSRRR